MHSGVDQLRLIINVHASNPYSLIRRELKKEIENIFPLIPSKQKAISNLTW